MACLVIGGHDRVTGECSNFSQRVMACVYPIMSEMQSPHRHSIRPLSKQKLTRGLLGEVGQRRVLQEGQVGVANCLPTTMHDTRVLA